MSVTQELVSVGGVSLETRLYAPVEPRTNDIGCGLVVCLHPWSRLGGNIADPVLSYLADALLENTSYYVLRFNSRGVGKSSGWASFTGLTEGKDLEELVQWALGTVPNVKSLVLLGYSHGSLVTTLHPILPEVKTSHILLSYPLGPRMFLTGFHSSTYITALRDLIRNPHSNVLIVHGDCDEFTGDSTYKTWVDELKNEAIGDPPSVVRVEGATHFWPGSSVRKLARVVQDWMPDPKLL